MKIRGVELRGARLALLTLAAGSLAVPALADYCTSFNNMSCPDGSIISGTICCPYGLTSWAQCNCNTWDSSTGYSNCGLADGCFS